MGTDIFVSYAREDEARIHELVTALEGKRWSVFWDHRIPAGQSWRSHIGRALDETRCAIVVWSSVSIASEFVLEEASRAKRRGVLVPVRIDPVDPPLGFSELNAADLCGWGGGRPSPEFDLLVQDLAAMLTKSSSAGARDPAPIAAVTPAPQPEPAPAPPVAYPVEAAPPAKRRNRSILLGGVAVAVIAAAVARYAMESGPNPAPVPVQAEPAHRPPSSTKTRAPTVNGNAGPVPPAEEFGAAGGRAAPQPGLPAATAKPGTMAVAQPSAASFAQPGGHSEPVIDSAPIRVVAKPLPVVLPLKSVRQALDRYEYDMGWSGAPLGTPDKGFSRSAVTKVVWRTTDVADIELARPSYLRATAGPRTLSGTWKDVDGEGDFWLEFAPDYSRAEGWWNRGGVTQKYNMFLRRTTR